MKNKKSRNRSTETNEDRATARRTRVLQIIVAIFSIILILSLILSALTLQ